MKYEIKKCFKGNSYFLVRRQPNKKRQDELPTETLEIISTGSLEAVQSCHRLHTGSEFKGKIELAFRNLYPRKEIV